MRRVILTTCLLAGVGLGTLTGAALEDGPGVEASGEPCSPAPAPAVADDVSFEREPMVDDAQVPTAPTVDGFGERSDPAAEAPEARALRAFARVVGAPGSPLEEPCALPASDDSGTCACERTVLEPFYGALDRSRARGSRTHVVILGNSLIASDGIINVLRRRLVERFGDGGPGLVLADRMASYGPRDRTARAAEGWIPATIAIPGDPLRLTPVVGHEKLPFGLAGVHHVSEAPAWSRFRLVDGAGTAQLFWQDRKAGPALSWRVEGGPWHELERRLDGGARMSELPIGTELVARRPEWVELRAGGPGAVIHGLVVERKSGVVVDTLGVPSADASFWLTVDEDVFNRQLQERSPALVVAMLGGNETRRLAWGRHSRAEIERDLRALLKRTRDVTPAACLVIGPIDAVQGTEAEGDDPFTPRRQVHDVIAIERKVALEEGCAFLDLFAAMGGGGSLKRFHDHDVLHDDWNHPRGKGLDVLGQLMADALLDAYARSARPVTAPLVAAIGAAARDP